MDALLGLNFMNGYVGAIAILLVSFLVATLVHLILRLYIKHVSSRTKTDLDDAITKIIVKPISALIILGGLYLSISSLAAKDVYDLWINRISFVLVVLIIAYAISKILSVLIGKWFKVKKQFARTPQLIGLVVSIIIYILAALMILSYLGIEITPLIAALGLGGLALGLALQNTLSNFFAGLHILTEKLINIGDFIELEGSISGYVEDIGWRSTRIRTLPNTMVIIPNGKLAESIVINNQLPEQEMATLVQCGVSYNSDLEKVEKVTIDVARKIQKTVHGAIKTFEPFIRFHTFSDSNINFTIILRVEKYVDKYLVTHELIKALKKRYDKEGIEISWPVRKVYYADESGKR